MCPLSVVFIGNRRINDLLVASRETLIKDTSECIKYSPSPEL